MAVIIMAVATAVIIFLVFRVFSNREKQLIKILYDQEKAGKLAEAILTARQLLDIHPNFAAYHWRLAKLYEKNNAPGSAVKVYETMKEKSLVSSTVKMEMILESLVILLSKGKEYAKVYLDSLLLIKYNPKNMTGLITLARIYAGQSRMDEAFNWIKEAIKVSPNSAEAHLYHGLMFLDTGDLKAALAELELSIKADSHNSNTQYFLAAAYRQAGFSDRAQDIFERLKMDPEKIPSNILNLGILRQHMPKLDLDELKQTTGKKGKTGSTVLTLEAFMETAPEEFHETVRSILGRMNFMIRQEIQDGSVDPKNTAAMIAEKDGTVSYIEFHRTEAEIGLIPFSEFIQRMEQKSLTSGLFITTSRLASSAQKLVAPDSQITVMEREALKRYLR